MRLSELARIAPRSLGLEVHRDGAFDVLGYVTHPINRRSLLVFAGAEKFLDACHANPLATCVITTRDLAQKVDDKRGVLIAVNPLEAFYAVHAFLHTETEHYWKGFDTEIHPSATVSPHAYVAPRNVRIGPGCVIEPGVVIHERSQLGARCFVRSNSVVASEGFEYKRLGGKMELIPHAGGAELGDDVRIHSGCMIDKGVFGEPTVLGAGTAMDNLVHIAHGVRCGKDCLFAVGAIVAGAVLIGDNVRFDPNCTVAHELVIGDGAYISLGAVVTDNVQAGQRVTGNFAMEHMKFYRQWLKSTRA